MTKRVCKILNFLQTLLADNLYCSVYLFDNQQITPPHTHTPKHHHLQIAYNLIFIGSAADVKHTTPNACLTRNVHRRFLCCPYKSMNINHLSLNINL